MEYDTWLVDGELSDEAFDWASDFSDEYTGDPAPDVIAKSLPEEMSDELKAAIVDVVTGLWDGSALMVAKPSSD